MTSKETQRNIMEEFDERFNKPITDEVHKLLNCQSTRNIYYDNTEIKNFITTSQDSLIQSIVDEVRVIRKQGSNFLDDAVGFNDALTQVQEMLRGLLNNKYKDYGKTTQ